MLCDWFQKWYFYEYNRHLAMQSRKSKRSGFVHRQLVYQCWQYDHAVSFLSATKAVVSNSKGHNMDRNPTKHRECHLPYGVTRESVSRNA